MPALRENSEAEPLLTGNGGVGQHQGDGNQLGKWCYMEYLYMHTHTHDVILLTEDGSILVSPIDEFAPPTYNSVSGGAPMVTCRVCQG